MSFLIPCLSPEHSLRSMKKDDLAKVLHHYEDYQKVLEQEDAGLSINKRRFNGLIEQIRILQKVMKNTSSAII